MTVPYSIRFAVPEEAAIITRQRRAMFEDMQSEWYLSMPDMDTAFMDWLHPRLISGEYVGWFALDANSCIAGGAGVRLLEWSPQSPDYSTQRAYIMNVYVEPEHRRQGVARLMITRILEWCHDQHIHHVSLHASDKGRGLYEELGFEATNEMRIYLL